MTNEQAREAVRADMPPIVMAIVDGRLNEYLESIGINREPSMTFWEFLNTPISQLI